MLRPSSILAIAIGLGLAIAQAGRNYDNLANWPTWGADIAAGLILAAAGYRALKRRWSRALSASWAFVAGIVFSAFVGHVMVMRVADPLGALYGSARELALITGALLVVAGAGVAMSLAAKPAA